MSDAVKKTLASVVNMIMWNTTISMEGSTSTFQL